jgi:iron complex transport system substrate-binding protein
VRRAALTLGLLAVLALPAKSDPVPQRIISLNLCTDQLLADLAPDRIIGLSPYAGPGHGAPILSGTAEEAMVMKPDLVVSGRFMKRATADFIRRQGIALEEFDFIRSVAEAKRQIARFGRLTGATDKAAFRIAEIDAALESLRAQAGRAKLSVLPYARRGWASGADSLMGDILREAGLANAAAELGLKAGGFVRLEQLVALRPDALLMAEGDGGGTMPARDQGQAMLLHPAILRLYPPERRILISERLANCGGPALAATLRKLRGDLERLEALPAR